MSTYHQLLLSTGGGVISNSQRDAQSPCATIAIGLGGTGVACLRNLKRQVYGRIQPDDPEAVVPTYSHIKFLAVDSDKKSLVADGKINSLNEDTEFFAISSTDIHALINNTRTMASSPEFRWLKTKNEKTGEPGISILSADAGAGGVRQIGRTLIVQKSAEFVARIESLIRDAMTAKPGEVGFSGNPEVNIHIFAGLSGGTGSGTFLDVCYLVRQALANAGVANALTLGYFFLPDVNLSVPAVANNPAVSKYIKSNGFAAMKELDYCMNIENNGGNWDQQYMGFHIGPISEPPVKICHLISAATTKGTQLGKHGFDYAMNVVGDFVMQFLVQNSISMQSHISNYRTAMAGVNKTAGANYTYCLLGASNAVVPMKEITTYLSSKLFDGMSKINGVQPEDGEIKEFARKNGLLYEQLYKELLKGTTVEYPAIELDRKLFTTMTETDLGTPNELVLPEMILKPYDTMAEKTVSITATNRTSMLREWSWENLNDDASSVSKVCKMYYALGDLVSDSQCGPSYAASVLFGTGRKNLVSLLAGAQKQAFEARGNIEKSMNLRMQEVKTARSAYLHPGVLDRLNKDKLFEDFIARVARYCSDKAKIKVLEELEGMLRIMQEQFKALYRDCFEKYARVIQDLSDTFDENYRVLTNVNAAEVVADPFIMPLMEITDEKLKRSLDDEVKKMNLDDEIKFFNAMLFKNYECWNSGDENQISKCVASYLVNKFSGYTNKTITGYLQIKYGTTNPGELIKAVHDDILSPLSDMATPLFAKAPAYSIASASPLGYCCVPNTSAEIQAATQNLISNPANSSLQLVTSHLADRIFFLRCTCGVPMHAYMSIPSYYAGYLADKSSVGKHYYEASENDPRDWSKLGNLQPFSTLGMNDLTEELIENSSVYDKAWELGIVNSTTIQVTPSIDTIAEEARLALESKAADKMEAVLDKVTIYINTVKPERMISIRNDGMQGHEDDVRKDHVMASDAQLQVLRDEIKKKQVLEESKKNLEKALEGIKEKKGFANEFFDALMTGVIDCQKMRITYIKKEWGMNVKEIELSVPSIEFKYGKLVPLYQAYLSYCELSEEERAEIVATSDKRINECAPELQQACDNLTALFTGAYLRTMQDKAKEIPDASKALVEEIVDFLLKFMKALGDFKTMYL